jgi:hypothetical protein
MVQRGKAMGTDAGNSVEQPLMGDSLCFPLLRMADTEEESVSEGARMLSLDAHPDPKQQTSSSRVDC